jgi:Flp pilus assembly protein TadD
MSQAFSKILVGALLITALVATSVMAAGTSDEAAPAEASTSAYDEAKVLVDAGDFAAALPKLVSLTAAQPDYADAWNLLGFTHRKLGQMDDSAKAYLVVLSINPDHLGALEYQGELFISTGKMDQAKGNLVKLQGLCGNCEEAEDLAKALQAAGA